jgi:hypothetical protein
MCFEINKDYPNELISNEDIVCYKRLYTPTSEYGDNGRHRSIIQGTTYWDFNKTKDFSAKNNYNEELSTLVIANKTSIYKGLHSYSTTHTAVFMFGNDICPNLKDIVQFVIPANTPYYYNPITQEYVSLKLHFVKILTLEELNL